MAPRPTAAGRNAPEYACACVHVTFDGTESRTSRARLRCVSHTACGCCVRMFLREARALPLDVCDVCHGRASGLSYNLCFTTFTCRVYYLHQCYRKFVVAGLVSRCVAGLRPLPLASSISRPLGCRQNSDSRLTRGVANQGPYTPCTLRRASPHTHHTRTRALLGLRRYLLVVATPSLYSPHGICF